MSYIGNQSGKIVYTNLNRFKGVVADLTALTAVTGASSGDMYKVEDSGHSHMYNGTEWVDMGPIVGPQGVKGTGITSVVRTSGDGSEGTVDVYTITYDDTSTSTFEVRNGSAGTIDHIAKTGTVGTTDTYTVYADAAKTQPLGSFEVYNGVDGTGVSVIDDTQTSASTTYSSTTIHEVIEFIKDGIDGGDIDA